MGRGYSASRSSSKRPIAKEQRARSVSLDKLNSKIAEISTKVIADQKEEKAAGAKKGKKGAVVKVDKAAEKERKRSAVAALREMDEDEDEIWESEDEETRIKHPEVMTKYKAAGKIVDDVLNLVCAACVTGATTKALVVLGDSEVDKACGAMFQKSKDEKGNKMKKGSAFPANVSVNHVLAHHAPHNDGEALTLKDGDIVKVHISAHFDGYPAAAARTIIVGAVDTVEQTAANTIAAAYHAMQGMIRLCKAGAVNGDITDFIHSIGAVHSVEAVEGVLSNRTKRWIGDGMDAIISRRVTREDPQQDVAPVELDDNQVWTLDVAFTNSPSYRMKLALDECNIFRRNEVDILTRLPASAMLIADIRIKHGVFPFTCATMDKPSRAKLGLSEIKKLDMVDRFPPLACKKGKVTARFCCTIAITNKRVHVLSGMPQVADVVLANAEALPADVAALIAKPLVATKVLKKKASDVAAAAESDEDDDKPKKVRRVEKK
jgi:curved DNA binding protein